MFSITDSKNPKKHGLVWDAKAKEPLIKFVKGKAVTDNKTLADKLQKMGYTVAEEKEKEKDDKNQG